MVKLSSKEIGTIYLDFDGHTLYLRDSDKTIICSKNVLSEKKETEKLTEYYNNCVKNVKDGEDVTYEVRDFLFVNFDVDVYEDAQSKEEMLNRVNDIRSESDNEPLGSVEEMYENGLIVRIGEEYYCIW